jgi:hypothetical protein
MDRLDAYPQQVKDVINYTRLMLGGATGNEKIFAFTPAMTYQNDYSIGVATLGESGYNANMFHSIRFPDYNAASDFCETLNGALGYSSDTATVIIIDTMKRSEFKRDQENGIVTVKLDTEQLGEVIAALEEYDNDDTNVLEVFESAKEELTDKNEGVLAALR